jgi:Uncharacterized conserved protein
MIPLMASKKYSVLTEVFYKFRRSDFDNILKNQSFYLIREIPEAIASRLLAPRIASILAMQDEDGLWPGKDRIRKTYDILSALQHVHKLESLQKEGRIKDAHISIAENYDYWSLLIKLHIYRELSPKDEQAIVCMVQDIKKKQLNDGSFDHTVFATVYHMERLFSLGVTGQDAAMQKAVSFLFKHLNKHWDAGTKARPGCFGSSYVFSTGNRILEFQSAQKYRAELMPLKVCFQALGIIQNAYCLRLLITLGLETNARVQAAMDSILALIEQYQGLCYFDIQNKRAAKRYALALN